MLTLVGIVVSCQPSAAWLPAARTTSPTVGSVLRVRRDAIAPMIQWVAEDLKSKSRPVPPEVDALLAPDFPSRGQVPIMWAVLLDCYACQAAGLPGCRAAGRRSLGRRTTPPRLSAAPPAQQQPQPVPAQEPQLATARFGMGCFWSPQEEFERLDGVLSARVGYARVQATPSVRVAAGAAPSYLSVCQGDGYTEAVEVTYDPSIVSYAQLLQTFWANHDAAEEIPGKEDQYASVLWPVDEVQSMCARADVARAAAAYASAGRPRPLTTVAPVDSSATFTPAEGYHQRFWFKARLKLGALVLLLLMRAPGIPELELLSTVGTQLVLAWWFVENFQLMAAANPFVDLL